MIASQTYVLRGCTQVISRNLREGKSLLFSAKVLVLARRLHKILFEKPLASRYVESLRARLGKLRQKLLEVIDQRMALTAAEPQALLDAMCASCLARTSSCAEVFRQFHHGRAKAIANRLEDVESHADAFQQALNLWIRTIREGRSIFPRKLANALTKLKAQPLIQDDGIRYSPELSLDIHGVWIDLETRNFVPYVRHDDLQADAAGQQASSWAASALNRLLSGMGLALSNVENARDIISIRHETVQSWLSGSGQVHGMNKKQVLDDLREIFRRKLSTVIDLRCQSIADVLLALASTIEDVSMLQSDNRSISGLWSGAIVRLDLSSGAEPFVDGLNGSYRGHTASLTYMLEQYDKWLGGVEGIRGAIKSMTEEHWNDEDEFEDALSDSEDEISAVRSHILLNVRDPEELASALSTALKAVQMQLVEAFHLADTPSSPSSALKASFLLRALREITARLPSTIVSIPGIHAPRRPSSRSRPSTESPLVKFLPLASSLHGSVAEPLVDAFVARHHGILKRLASTHGSVPGLALWDDQDPPLPTLPSPAAFRLLREFHKALDSAGPDLWTAPAVQVLKSVLRDKLAGTLLNAGSSGSSTGAGDQRIKSGESETVQQIEIEAGSSGNGTEDGTASVRREACIQRLFDLDLLRSATSMGTESLDESKADSDDATSSGDALDRLRAEWTASLDLASDEAEKKTTSKRLQESANACWGRSKLLFGLLTP